VALMAAGLSEQTTMLICVPLALVFGLSGWLLADTLGFRLERYGRYGEKGYAWRQALRWGERSKTRFKPQMQDAWGRKRLNRHSKLMQPL
jgi:hypothetical protein